MKPVAVLKSKPVLVRKKAQMGFSSQGPVMMYGGGGDSGGTRTGRALSALGGVAGGVLGAVEGKHRTLGGLAQGIQQGHYLGRAAGGLLGNLTRLIPGAANRLRRRGIRAEAEEEDADKRARMHEDYRTEWQKYQKKPDALPVGLRQRHWGDDAKEEFLAEQDPTGKYGTTEDQAAAAEAKELQHMKDKKLRQLRAHAGAQRAFTGEERGYSEAQMNDILDERERLRDTNADPAVVEMYGRLDRSKAGHPLTARNNMATDVASATSMTPPVMGAADAVRDELAPILPDHSDHDGEQDKHGAFGPPLMAPPLDEELPKPNKQSTLPGMFPTDDAGAFDMTRGGQNGQ
jgi:hypothetical protein